MAPKTPQKTQLDDNAEIYKRRDPKSERDKLKEMNFSEKVDYFKIYYLKKLLALIVIVGMLIWIVVTIVIPKPKQVLNVAFVNYPITQDYLDKMETDLTKLLNVDSKNEKILFDTSYDLSNNNYASAEKIMTYTYSGEIDIFIAPESKFAQYAFTETMWPLTDLLPTDLYSTFSTSDLFVCKTKANDKEMSPEQATGPQGVYGIYLKDLDMFDIFDTTTDPPVLGVIVTAKNKENAISYIKYLLNK